MKHNKTSDIINRITIYLENNKINFEALENIKEIEIKNKGKESPLSEHIKGLVYSLLSNQRKWITVIPKLPEIDALFFNYNSDKILKQSPEYFMDGIYNLKCGNISTKKQMNALHENIRLFLTIIVQHGSIDNFYSNYSTNEVALLLSNPKSEYKLKSVGYALAWQYLRNIGYDGAKPDVHLRRILGSDRLNYGKHPTATEDEVLKSIEEMSIETGYSRSYINDLLWYFCSPSYGNICNSKPNCEACGIRKYCNYSSSTIANNIVSC